MYEGLISKLKAINPYKIAEEYINRNENTILNLVRERMKQGDGVDGGTIGEYKSLDYSYFKQSINPLAGGYVDLYLTGSLQKALGLREESSGVYLIHSTDNKYFALADKYGANQFGLTYKQQSEIKKEVSKEIITKINKAYE